MSRAVLLLVVVVAVCALTEGSFKHRLHNGVEKIKHAAYKGAALGAATLGATVGVVSGTAEVIGGEVLHGAQKVKDKVVSKVNHARQHVADAIAPHRQY